MSYDYCGYGQSSGRPNESNLNKACAAAYEKMGERFGIRPEQVILYGQSIGTGTRFTHPSNILYIRSSNIIRSAIITLVEQFEHYDVLLY